MPLRHTSNLRWIAASLCCSLLVASMTANAQDQPANEPKVEAKKDKEKPKAAADPKVKAKQAAETLDALGKVFDVFGAALGGGRPAVAERAVPVDIAEPVAAEPAVVVGEVLADIPAPAADAAVGADPLEQQFLQQFRQLSKTELNFVRAICQPNAEQSKKIKAASEVGLKTAVKKFAEIQKKLQQGIRAGEQPQWPDPRKLMADALLKSVKETMSAEQAKRYEEELAKRSAARQHAALLNLVAKLDKDLVLTADQREKLSEALSGSWKEAWGQQLETFMYGDTYMPALPDAQVIPVLTEKQKQIWTGLPKHHNQIWGWAGFGFVQVFDAEEVLAEPAVQIDVDIKVEVKQVDEKKEESP
jgi:hypothetical protein